MADVSIAVDAMGGNMGTAEIVRGVSLAFRKLENLESIVLVGKERLLKRLIEVAGLANEPRLSIHPASQVIGMDEMPIQSVKRKKDSSMARAIGLVKKGRCQAVVSCGNTGSLMAGSTIRLRPLQGIERPALATAMPSKKRYFIVVDAGANPSARPNHLVHYAVLGSHYARVQLGLPKPRVGLLSNGTEESKGNELTVMTHQRLKKIGCIINYLGMIEGLDVFNNRADVIVCDGFTGNIMLKACESLFLSMKDFLKEEIQKNPIRLTGSFLSQGAFRGMRDQLSPDRYGGAPLLGLRGHVVKAHGSSNKVAFMNAIRVANTISLNRLNESVQSDILAVNEILKEGSSKSIAAR